MNIPRTIIVGPVRPIRIPIVELWNEKENSRRISGRTVMFLAVHRAKTFDRTLSLSPAHAFVINWPVLSPLLNHPKEICKKRINGPSRRRQWSTGTGNNCGDRIKKKKQFPAVCVPKGGRAYRDNIISLHSLPRISFCRFFASNYLSFSPTYCPIITIRFVKKYLIFFFFLFVFSIF